MLSMSVVALGTNSPLFRPLDNLALWKKTNAVVYAACTTPELYPMTY